MLNELSDSGTWIFEVDVGAGGCTWWVSAGSALQAFRLVDSVGGFDDVPDTDPIAVDLADEKSVGAATFWTEEGKRIPLIDEWQRDVSPRVIACSEF